MKKTFLVIGVCLVLSFLIPSTGFCFVFDGGDLKDYFREKESEDDVWNFDRYRGGKTAHVYRARDVMTTAQVRLFNARMKETVHIGAGHDVKGQLLWCDSKTGFCVIKRREADSMLVYFILLMTDR
ncbi:hypothetical protein ACFLZC_00810 [Patescibacteria group bacterium]